MSASEPVDTTTPVPGTASPRPARRRRIVLFALVAAVALTLDIVSKVLVVDRLGNGHPPVRLLGGALYLDLARNSGAAFSLGAGTGFTAVLTVIAAAVVAVIIRTARRMRSIGWAIALGLVLGGALGNLTDRMLREPGIGRGDVVDWISVFGPYGAHFPIFNLADSAVCCGAVLAGLLALLGVDLDGGAQRRPRHGE